MWNPLNLVKKVVAAFENLTSRTKVIVAVLVLFVLTGTGIAGYKMYDYTWNDPTFCVACHVMQGAFKSWEKSVHKNINCHDCHHLSPKEGTQLLVSFVVNRPETLPDRHGKVIVPGKFCVDCHYQTNKKFPQAHNIKNSNFHAKHGMVEKIECSKCHGLVAHQFLPEERFCLYCHKDKVVHGAGMQGLACLNCHSDATKDLRPEQDKCLFCHGSEEVTARMYRLLRTHRLDTEFFAPPPEAVEKAIKIVHPAGSPHYELFCYECHKPHISARPKWNEVCVGCHGDAPDSKVHKTHLAMDMKCKDCHKPHTWDIRGERAKKECTKCHEYRDPNRFIKS
jgi:cytochrome c nitrite reductase small subunit